MRMKGILILIAEGKAGFSFVKDEIEILVLSKSQGTKSTT